MDYKIIKSTFSVECNKNRVVLYMADLDVLEELPTTEWAYGSLAAYIASGILKVYILNIDDEWTEVTSKAMLSDII